MYHACAAKLANILELNIISGRQQCVQFRKSQKSAESLQPTPPSLPTILPAASLMKLSLAGLLTKIKRKNYVQQYSSERGGQKSFCYGTRNY